MKCTIFFIQSESLLLLKLNYWNINQCDTIMLRFKLAPDYNVDNNNVQEQSHSLINLTDNLSLVVNWTPMEISNIYSRTYRINQQENYLIRSFSSTLFCNLPRTVYLCLSFNQEKTISMPWTLPDYVPWMIYTNILQSLLLTLF